MRPHNAPSLKARRAQARRSIQQSLPWLPGWPVPDATQEGTIQTGVVWQPLKGGIAGKVLVLTGMDVAVATRLRTHVVSWEKELKREIVKGDWESQVSAILKLLQATIHEKQPLPSEIWSLYPREIVREARHIIAQLSSYPALTPIFNALSYWCAPEPEQALLHLKTLQRYPICFAQLLPQTNLLTTVRWLEILPQGARLATWLNDPRLWELDLAPKTSSTITAPTVAQGWSWSWEPPANTPVRLPPLLLPIQKLDSQPRARALILLSHLLPQPDDILGPWSRWWEDIMLFTQWFRSSTEVTPEQIHETAQRIITFPKPFKIQEILTLACILGEDPHWEIITAFMVAIHRIAPNFSLVNAANILREQSEWGHLEPESLRKLVTWLQKADLASEAIPHLMSRGMLHTLLRNEFSPLGLKIFEDFLNAGEIPSEAQLHSLFHICSVAPTRARELWSWVRDLPGFWYGLFDLLLKVEYPDVQGGDIRTLYQRFIEKPSIDIHRVLKAVGHSQHHVGLWLAAGGRNRLELLNRLLVLSKAKPIFAPEVPPIPAWADRFPTAMAPALGRLASVHPTAEQTATALLSKEFPDPQEQLRTIRYLEAQVTRPDAPEHLKRRLAILKQRQAAPPLVLSSLRVRRLIEKLDHACSNYILDSWVLRAEQDVQNRLTEATGFSADRPLAPVFWEARSMMAISALLELTGQSRELTRRILQIRSGPPPWDFRDEPANAAFLERMRAEKINVEPWLSGWETVRKMDGHAICFAIEQDPLEVLWMGEQFQSCLSFGGCNFFSVISNIVDINKQVLYGRRNGQIVLRCLLALTHGGGLLSFTLYRHIKEDGLEEVFQSVLLELAGEMRSMLVADGRVDRLVASDWYDDGPVDRAHRFPVLQDQRQKILGMAPGEFIKSVPYFFDGLPLNALTAGVLVGVVREQPRLLEALLPWIVQFPPEDPLWVEVAHALMGRESRWRLLGALGWRAMERNQEGWLPLWVMAELAEREPVRMLKVVRGWNESKLRWYILGICQSKMGRMAQARQAFLRALKMGGMYGASISEALAAMREQAIPSLAS